MNLLETNPAKQLGLTLIDFHDLDDDHEVGGMDLPFRVVAKASGDIPWTQEIINKLDFLVAFNISADLEAKTIKFLSFEELAVRTFFGLDRRKTNFEWNNA